MKREILEKVFEYIDATYMKATAVANPSILGIGYFDFIASQDARRNAAKDAALSMCSDQPKDTTR